MQQEFGKDIRKIRHQLGLTQAQLAEKMGISDNYVGDIENNRKNMSLAMFLLLAKGLDYAPPALLNRLLTVEEEQEIMVVDFEIIKQAYQNWKALNLIIGQDMASRKVNFPEALSENIACTALGLTRNMTGVTGDATDENGNLIEIKASANFNSDLSSFSPNTHFDRLIFVRLNLDTDQAYIYDLGLNGQQFGGLQVNSNQLVSDHQRQGRRPRLSLIKYIDNHQIPPVTIVNLA
ncbi:MULTISPECIES: Bsp6I family type II restriction endonuclease [unclassified Moraxella]|uniref:Bsp6I family type II restriction endonuclease n=1 Tax=unclassified Moraxella TaxID=2685852 RepID=UPI003AF51CB2